MTMKVAYLNISTWEGISVGACHFYGSLSCGKKTIDIERVLTKSTASRLNQKRAKDLLPYEKGSETALFLSSASVRRRAIATFREHFPKANILVEGRRSVVEPQPVLVGPESLKEQVNAWCKRKHDLDCSEDEWDEICDVWELIFPWREK